MTGRVCQRGISELRSAKSGECEEASVELRLGVGGTRGLALQRGGWDAAGSAGRSGCLHMTLVCPSWWQRRAGRGREPTLEGICQQERQPPARFAWLAGV